jgi:predicted nucleic acid-binding protein
VLGRRVRELIEVYAARGIRFYAPDISFADAANYLPQLLKKRGRQDTDVPAALQYFEQMISSVGPEFYGAFEDEARARLRGRDEDDWPVLAAALGFGCAVWTEDADFFGTGVAVWTTHNIEIFLKAQSTAPSSADE